MPKILTINQSEKKRIADVVKQIRREILEQMIVDRNGGYPTESERSAACLSIQDFLGGIDVDEKGVRYV